MTTRSIPLIAAASVAPLLLAGVVGCQSSNFSASALPPEFVAPSGAGRQQIRLEGLASVGGVSTAIGPADLLEVTIISGHAGDASEPARVRVRDDGAVDVPYVGPVAVAGYEPTAAANQITAAAISRGVYRRPQVHVALAEQATHRVTVLGAVAEPGLQEVPRGACDILTAVAAAGGFTDEAGTVVEVLRHGQPTLASQAPPAEADGVTPVSFDAPALAPPGGEFGRSERIDLADTASAPLAQQRLSDRDVVIVRPREKRVVHVSGLVQRPDQFELTEDHDLRVLDAIAMAGGTTSAVADKVLVIRHVEGRAEPVVIATSLAKAKRDGAQNLLLQSGDLVSVESTVATTVVDTFRDLFRITMGVGGNLALF